MASRPEGSPPPLLVVGVVRTGVVTEDCLCCHGNCADGAREGGVGLEEEE